MRSSRGGSIASSEHQVDVIDGEAVDQRVAILNSEMQTALQFEAALGHHGLPAVDTEHPGDAPSWPRRPEPVEVVAIAV